MKVIMLIGSAGCGKTTASNILTKLIQNSIVISFDVIRKDLYGDISILGDYNKVKRNAKRTLKSAIYQDRDVIFDAPNTNKTEREEFINKFYQLGVKEVIGIWIDTPINLCLERNLSRHDREVPVKERHIQTMTYALQNHNPNLEEGFSKLHHLKLANKTLPELEEIYKDII